MLTYYWIFPHSLSGLHYCFSDWSPPYFCASRYTLSESFLLIFSNFHTVPLTIWFILPKVPLCSEFSLYPFSARKRLKSLAWHLEPFTIGLYHFAAGPGMSAHPLAPSASYHGAMPSFLCSGLWLCCSGLGLLPGQTSYLTFQDLI